MFWLTRFHWHSTREFERANEQPAGRRLRIRNLQECGLRIISLKRAHEIAAWIKLERRHAT